MAEYMTYFSNIDRHPFQWVSGMLKYEAGLNKISPSVILSFSKYRYIPQSFDDQRVSFGLPLYQLNKISLFDIISGLGEGEELAIHSLVSDMGRELHIPLIDFGNKDMSVIDSSPLKELSSHWGMAFQIYSSGRSYHAYGNRLLDNRDWIKFMGSLLLLNKPGVYKIIDDRWIGHRILAGYAALRWSNNSSHYKKIPSRVGYLSPNGLMLETKNNHLI